MLYHRRRSMAAQRARRKSMALSPFGALDGPAPEVEKKENNGMIASLYKQIIKMSAENVRYTCEVYLVSISSFYLYSYVYPPLFLVYSPMFNSQKINAKNTWSLPLIENIDAVIADGDRY